MSLLKISESALCSTSVVPVLPPVATLLLREAVTPKCAVTVTECKVRGDIQYQVRFWEDGKIRRRFFPSRATADAFAADQKGEALINRQRLLLLPPERQALLLVIDDETQRLGMPLTRLLGMLEITGVGPIASATIEKVLEDLTGEMAAAHRDEGYIVNFKSVIKKFYRGQESRDVSRFTVEDINRYFVGKSAGFKKTLRSRLSTLFANAVLKGYRADNPCAKLAKVTCKKSSVMVLTVAQAKTCLEWFLKNPKGLGWFINTAFAGLRPKKEACLTGWDKIDFDGKYIVVEADVCKTGKRRVVYADDMVFDWLMVAKKLGSKLPLGSGEKELIQRELRAVLGWPEWFSDVTRHSAASYWLAKTNDVKQVSRSLGHSITMLESTYDARVLQKEGLDYFGLTPASLNADK